MKRCPGCKEIKDNFGKRQRAKDGLATYCKDCVGEYNELYRLLHPDYWKQNTRNIRSKVFTYYGGKCNCCGEKEYMFLTLDHVNNDGAEHRRSLSNRRNDNMPVYKYLISTEFAEADRFQVLCWNCNCGKRSNGGVCPHVR